MAYTRTLVILANSVKKGRYCVAGKDLETGEWVRPVASAAGDGLPCSRVRVTNPYGTFRAKPLQVVEMGFQQPVPLATQPENHLTDDTAWRQRYKKERERLHLFVDTPEHLWMYGPETHRFPTAAIGGAKGHQSLYLVAVETVEFRVKTNYWGHKRIVAYFTYNGVLYGMSVTDPAYADYLRHDIGYEWQETRRYLCLSQTDDFHGHCYKVVAAVL